MTRPRVRLALALALLVAPAARAQVAPARYALTRAWPVMGTMFVVRAWGTDTTAMLAAMQAAHDSVKLVDSLMSVYRPTSDISRANAAAGRAATRVSPQTMHVLRQARRFWAMSGGRFDPTVGPLVRAWGFFSDSGRVPARREIDSLRRLVGYGAVEIDTVALTVRLPRAGMSLDLGGIAKGYALDLARAGLDVGAVTGGTVDLGGNILAFGRPPHGRRWQIGVVHPRHRDRLLGVLSIDSGAVATSGDYEHFFIERGVRYSHLIDPTTGRPARGVVAATVVGPRGEWSDGLSATVLLSGARRGSAIADSLPGVAAIVVRRSRDGTVHAADVALSRRARSAFSAQPSAPSR